MHICHIKHSTETDNIDEVLLTSISIIYHIYIPFCFTETSYGGLKSCPFEFLPVSFNQCNTFKPYSVFSRHVNFSTRVPVWVHISCRTSFYWRTSLRCIDLGNFLVLFSEPDKRARIEVGIFLYFYFLYDFDLILLYHQSRGFNLRYISDNCSVTLATKQQSYSICISTE